MALLCLLKRSSAGYKLVNLGQSRALLQSVVQRNSVALPGITEPWWRHNTVRCQGDKSDATARKPTVKHYMQLSKSRLTGLVMTTAGAGYVLAPSFCATVAPSVAGLALVVGGTALLSAGANTINQLMERRHDALMTRTACRPLVVHNVTTAEAVAFAAACGVAGASLLCVCNPLSAALGVGNLLLYTLVYTPMKRFSVANTWVGAVVGGVPPLIGWAAATGGLGFGQGWLLAALLYAWQFPHFNALSWNLRKEYARAGFCMAASYYPGMCRRVARRYGVAIGAVTLLAGQLALVNPLYVVLSTPANLYLMWLCCGFCSEPGSSSARRLTRFSYVYLATVLLLLLATHSQLASALTDRLPGSPLTPAPLVPRLTEVEWGQRGPGYLWCVARPLIEAGCDLSSLVALAERFQQTTSATKRS